MPGTVWEVVQNTRELQQTPEHEAQCRPCRPQAADFHPLPYSNSREKEFQIINSRENRSHHCRIVCTTLISFIIRSIISITKLAIACTTIISFIISITQLTIVAINIASTTIIP